MASLLAALAWNEPSLIGARALQGLGAAIIAPAALSILMTTFSEGKERNIALGVWGAVGGFGAAAGVLLGGIFTDALSWEWIFFLNIPVGAHRDGARTRAARARAATRARTASTCSARCSSRRALDRRVRHHAGERLRLELGEDDRHLRRCCTAARRLRARETRAKDPLMSFSIFRIKTVAGANIAGFILGTALFSMFLMLTLYMQQVLGYSAMKTGFAYIAVAGQRRSSGRWSPQQLVTRVGVKPVLVTGMSLLTVGLLYFTQVSVDGSYLGDLLPGFLDHRVGHGVLVRPDLDRGARRRAGEGRGARVRADQHVAADRRRARHRGALVGRDRADERRDEGRRRRSQALTSGFQAAFWVGAGIAAVGVLASLVLIRKEELAAAPAFEPEAEALAEAA